MRNTSPTALVLLSLLLSLSLLSAPGAAAAAAGATPSPTAVARAEGGAQLQAPDDEERGEQEKKKDKKGKRVRATLVEPEPDPRPAEDGEQAEAERPGEPAAEEADRIEEESAPAAEAATAEETAEPVAREASPATETTEAPDQDDPTAAFAEDRDLPAFDERVEVIEVLLDVLVEDRKDGIVTGLDADDFVVEEDGRPVEVTSATFYGTPEQLAATGEGGEGVERSDRYFILFFHDRARDAPFLRPLLLDAAQQARRWIEQDLLPNDQVAVLSYDVKLKVMSDFTRDKEALLKAVSRAAASRKEPDRRRGRSEEALRPADSPSLLLNLPAALDLRRETGVFEETLALLGRAAEGIVGRKNLLLFSVGFGESDLGGMWIPDQRYYPEMEKSLNDGNVAVYAIDLVGSRRLGGATGISSSLSSVAADTSGLYFESFTSFATPLRQAAEDTQGYYLLAYRSEYPRGETGYREVEVSTTDQSHRVRARQGYRYGDPVSVRTRPAAGAAAEENGER